MSDLPIRAVLFDLGGTLEDVWFDETIQRTALKEFLKLLKERIDCPDLTEENLYTRLTKGMAHYKTWRETRQREMDPEGVFRTFVLKGIPIPADIPVDFWETLAFHYESRFFYRELRPETPTVLEALKKGSLKLGVISNIMSRSLVPHRLKTCGIEHYFDVVLTSSTFGIRKPNPAIFLKAVELLKMSPAEAIYIGDTLSRDVAGARRAGFKKAIQIRSFFTSISDSPEDREAPDLVIQSLSEVLSLVPRNGDTP